MRPIMVLVCAVLIGLGWTGCAKKEQEQSQQTSGGTQVAAPSESESQASPTPSTAAVDTAGSVDELFSQIHQQESSLSQSIAAGHLNELGTETTRIRELLSQAVKLSQAHPLLLPEFKEHVAEAKRVSVRLVEAGKEGSVEECKTLNADLQNELGAVERMILRPRT